MGLALWMRLVGPQCTLTSLSTLAVSRANVFSFHRCSSEVSSSRSDPHSVVVEGNIEIYPVVRSPVLGQKRDASSAGGRAPHISPGASAHDVSSASPRSA